jgi:hypothetical protein
MQIQEKTIEWKMWLEHVTRSRFSIYAKPLFLMKLLILFEELISYRFDF